MKAESQKVLLFEIEMIVRESLRELMAVPKDLERLIQERILKLGSEQEVGN